MYRGEVIKAIEIFQQCANLLPGSPLNRFYLIKALLENGDVSKAKIVADEIRNLDPTFRIKGFIIEYGHLVKRRDSFKADLNKMGFME